MNKNQAIINRNKREYLDQTKKIHENVVAINIGNTFGHELNKFQKAWELMRDGHTIVTEAVFKSGLRADILVISTEEPIAYEIISSETQKSIDKKNLTYPCRIEWVKI